MKKYLLEIVVFICGACLMILEIIASRILAPFVGTSTIVWTAIIGVIMGFLSLGYWWGGKLADKQPTHKFLAKTILFNALFVLFIIFINFPLLFLLLGLKMNIYVMSTISSVLFFAFPSFMFGIIAPYAAKLKMQDLENSGKIIGRLYAISTVGSIFGTFLTGFVLIPFFGTTKILFIIAITLFTVSLLLCVKNNYKTKILFLCLIVMSFLVAQNNFVQTKNFNDIDTEYNRVWVYQGTENDRPVMKVQIDPLSTQSAMYLDNPNELVFDYTKFYNLGDYFVPNIKNALMIGGAGYSFPKFFLSTHPDAKLTVVEIDPGMTKIAQKYFHLPVDNKNLEINHEDARTFLNNSTEKFDTIYIDAFNSHLSIPYQLTTKEAVQKLYNSLDKNGVVIINIISSFTGEKNSFLQAELKTYKEIFANIKLFQVKEFSFELPQNIIMIAGKTKLNPNTDNTKKIEADIMEMLNNEYTEIVELNLPTLTDNYAPVDYYISKLNS
ncbi:MAG TPA: spermidine synthase [Candidatus Magasanikbacteria bacterium]|nr:spermidine synthase [Candidatus Magasanikbacteria bacterium]